jgi:hypothetical protein
MDKYLIFLGVLLAICGLLCLYPWLYYMVGRLVDRFRNRGRLE